MTHPLKAYRRAHQITLAALAAATGLSKSHLSLIENGRAPGRKTIEILCMRTGLSPAVFFQGAAPAPPAQPQPALGGET